jgi:hypothetical protein
MIITLVASNAGEYLMALPQQLEVLMADEAAAAAGGSSSSSQEAAALQAEAAEGDELAAEWLDKVRGTTARCYGRSFGATCKVWGLVVQEG